VVSVPWVRVRCSEGGFGDSSNLQYCVHVEVTTDNVKGVDA
jgi:hypothetical protein